MTAPPLAVVSGAASGIGLALSHELVARSFEVVAIDREPMPRASLPGIHAFQMDVGDPAAMQHIADSFAGRPLACLFANAGIGAPGSVLGASPHDWQQAWCVNTMGPLNCVRSWWPHLVAGRGSAVFTGSLAALLSYPGAALYRATKAALLSMLEGLYYETRDAGVGLHVLLPGMVRTGIVANALASGAAAGNPFTDYLLEAMRSAEPASAFAARVLDRLENAAAPPPFYWLTHADSVRKLDTRHRAIVVDGMPTEDFGSLQ